MIEVEIYYGYVDNLGASIKSKANGVAMTFEELEIRDRIMFTSGMAYQVGKGPEIEVIKRRLSKEWKDPK